MRDRVDEELTARLDAEARAEAKRPICECCGQPIWADFAVYYNDQWICAECEHDFWDDVRTDFMKETD